MTPVGEKSRPPACFGGDNDSLFTMKVWCTRSGAAILKASCKCIEHASACPDRLIVITSEGRFIHLSTHRDGK